jgi:hypothetical protein
MSVERCHALVESFATGQWAELMWAFGRPGTGIESADPDLLALIDKRTGRLRDMEWSISLVKGHEKDAAALAQQAALQAAYDRFDNLYAAIAALGMAKFRGIAACEVDWEGSALRVIEPWNLLRDGYNGNLAYNPGAAASGYASMPEEYRYNPDRHWWIVRDCPRPIGAWALYKAFYCALGSRDWGAYCGIYGIPGGIVTGPPSMTDTEKSEFAASAVTIAGGGTGVIPFGASYTPNSDSRGVLPFEPWMDWLSKKLILAGTGGALTMLSEATGMGSGNAENHADTFSELAKSDAREISECLNRQFDRRVLADSGLLAPGSRPLAYFTLAANEDTNVSTIIDHASKLATAGLEIDIADLQDRTGYKLARRELPLANPMALQNASSGLQIAPNKEAAPSLPPAPSKPLQGKAAELLRILEADPGDDATFREALKLLDTMTPADIGADEHAAALEKMLMEAVILGASGQPAPKKTPASGA